MDWKTLEELTHERNPLPEQQIEEISRELLGSIAHETKPLQAAKIAYTLCLLQLRATSLQEEKALQFLAYFQKITSHEITESEKAGDEAGTAHLLYVHKLVEHYLHHLHVTAALVKAKKFVRHVQALRRNNHDASLQLRQQHQVLWKKERALIRKGFQRNYLFAGFLFALSLYFAWTSFWQLSDFAMAQWVFSEWSSDSISFLIRDATLFVFSLSVALAFVKYQTFKVGEEE